MDYILLIPWCFERISYFICLLNVCCWMQLPWPWCTWRWSNSYWLQKSLEHSESPLAEGVQVMIEGRHVLCIWESPLGTRNMLLNLDLDSRFFRTAYLKSPLHSSCFQYGSGFWPTVGVALQMILLPCWLWYHDWKKSSDCEAQTSRLSNSPVMWKDFVALSFQAVQ